MKNKLVVLLVGSSLVLSACADSSDRAPDATGGAPTTAPGSAARTPGVDPAPQGMVNEPKEGVYRYDYDTETTNAATPNATPRRSSPDAELSSTVTAVDGAEGVYSVAEKSSEGPAVATVIRRYEDDRIVELSFETTTPQDSSGCEFTQPIVILRIPIEMGSLGEQRFAGEGNSCNGSRTVTVEAQEDVTDAAGVMWSSRRVKIENVIRSGSAVISRSTQTLWFSPDLGKEVKTESEVEALDAEGDVSARGTTTSLLKAYPT